MKMTKVLQKKEITNLQMGTNYYLQHRVSDTGRVQDMHICKFSSGWTVSLVGYNQEFFTDHQFHIKTWFDWKLFLTSRIKDYDGLIFNEYDEAIPLLDFIQHVEEWEVSQFMDGDYREARNHAKEALDGKFGTMYFQNDKAREEDMLKKTHWIDPEGYSFHDGEFS